MTKKFETFFQVKFYFITDSPDPKNVQNHQKNKTFHKNRQEIYSRTKNRWQKLYLMKLFKFSTHKSILFPERVIGKEIELALIWYRPQK